MWCLTGLEKYKQVAKRTGVVGHKSLSTKRHTKRFVVKSLSDIETAILIELQSIANIPFYNYKKKQPSCKNGAAYKAWIICESKVTANKQIQLC